MSEEYYEEEFDDSVEKPAEKMVDNDELSPKEAAFIGYDEAADPIEEEEEIDKEFE